MKRILGENKMRYGLTKEQFLYVWDLLGNYNWQEIAKYFNEKYPNINEGRSGSANISASALKKRYQKIVKINKREK